MTTETIKPWTDYLRSSVRPLVTFAVILVYLSVTGAAVVILLLGAGDHTDSALALLSGLAAVATGIVGFWFGTRGAGGLGGKEADDTTPSEQEETTEGDGAETTADVEDGGTASGQAVQLSPPLVASLKEPISAAQLADLNKPNAAPKPAVASVDLLPGTELVGVCKVGPGASLELEFQSLRKGAALRALPKPWLARIVNPKPPIQAGRKVSVRE